MKMKAWVLKNKDTAKYCMAVIRCQDGCPEWKPAWAVDYEWAQVEFTELPPPKPKRPYYWAVVSRVQGRPWVWDLFRLTGEKSTLELTWYGDKALKQKIADTLFPPPPGGWAEDEE